MTAVRVELIVAGSCRSVGRLAVAGHGLRPVDFPALVAVIEHPQAGIILFDTGYTDRFARETHPFPQRFYRWLTPLSLEPAATAVAQLRARGVAAGDVEHVVVSHLHADHVAGLLDFPRARISLSDRETPPGWRSRSAWSCVRHAVLPGLLPDDLDARRSDGGPREGSHSSGRPGRSGRGARVETGLPGGLATGLDLLGDGSVLVLDLAGHTPGHRGLFLPATQGPALLLVGDACWSRAAYTDLTLPPAAVQRFMADGAAYRSVIADLAVVHRTRPDVAIVPSHCPESIAAARLALGA